MTRRIVILLDHSIEEFDQLRLLHEIGHEVASIGGYIDPSHPHDDKRPALPQVPMVQVVKDAVDALGAEHPDTLAAAKEHIPDAVLDWADTLIWHHYLHRLYGQWPRIRDWLAGDSNRRVIWRTVGQSVDGNEHDAQPFRAEGLEIVRYSPKERNIPLYAGEDALIRFYKDPAEWYGWTGTGQAFDGEASVGWGTGPWVGNVTQNLKQRDPWTHYGFWKAATDGLAAVPAGPGSQEIGGVGNLPYDEMRAYLRAARCYLYTGTQPASYTLGLIEAMMTGVPVVAMGPGGMAQPIFPYVPQMYEAHEIVGPHFAFDQPGAANGFLFGLLNGQGPPALLGGVHRQRAIELFGIETIAAQWRAYLG